MSVEGMAEGGVGGILATVIFANVTGAAIFETVVLAAVGGIVGVLISAILKPWATKLSQRIKHKIDGEKRHK